MEKIDLTWSGLFGGEGDGSNRQTFERDSYELLVDTGDRPNRKNLFITAILQQIVDPNCVLRDRVDDNIDSEATYFTAEFFEDLNPRLYEVYFDPYASMINFCDCCGKELNILNRVYFLCERCDNNGDRDILFNESTANIMFDMAND